MNGEAVRAHGSKTFCEFLFHGIDGGIDAHQRHDTESNNCNGDACAKFITAYRAKASERTSEVLIALKLIIFGRDGKREVMVAGKLTS